MDWIWAERAWLFSGLVITIVVGLIALLRKPHRPGSEGIDLAIKALTDKLHTVTRESVEKDTQIKALKDAVEALTEQEGPANQAAPLLSSCPAKATN